MRFFMPYSANIEKSRRDAEALFDLVVEQAVSVAAVAEAAAAFEGEAVDCAKIFIEFKEASSRGLLSTPSFLGRTLSRSD